MSVQVARSAIEGLREVMENPAAFDVLITEVDFPHMSGLEAIARARETLAERRGPRFIAGVVRGLKEIPAMGHWAFEQAAVKAGVDFVVAAFGQIRCVSRLDGATGRGST